MKKVNCEARRRQLLGRSSSYQHENLESYLDLLVGECRLSDGRRDYWQEKALRNPFMDGSVKPILDGHDYSRETMYHRVSAIQMALDPTY